MNSNIGILGCGWLGLPLASTMVKNKYSVHGSTTSQDKIEALKEKGITPYLIKLSENGITGDIDGFLTDIDILIINIPPRLRRDPKENYVKRITHLHKALIVTKIRTIIFISSTSVYGDLQGTVTEDTQPQPNTESGRQLFETEAIFKENKDLNTTIIRFGGLIGPNRHPAKFLSGKKDLTNGMDPVNLIHLNDCIGLIRTVIEKKHSNILINGVYPLHPTKEEYYTSEARKIDVVPPTFLPSNHLKSSKIIENSPKTVKIYQYHTSIIS